MVAICVPVPIFCGVKKPPLPVPQVAVPSKISSVGEITFKTFAIP